MSPTSQDPNHPTPDHSGVQAAARERAQRLKAVGCEPCFYTSKHGTVSVIDVSRIGHRTITDRLESRDPLTRLMGEIEARGYILEGFTPEAAVLSLIDQLIDRVIELEAPLVARGSPRKLEPVR